MVAGKEEEPALANSARVRDNSGFAQLTLKRVVANLTDEDSGALAAYAGSLPR